VRDLILFVFLFLFPTHNLQAR